MAVPSTEALPDAALPEAGPALVLVGTERGELRPTIDRLAVDAAGTLDVRTDVAWVDVPDALAFARRLLDAVPEPADRAAVRIAWAPSDSTVDRLMRAALDRVDLAEVARAVARLEAGTHPPVYEVRYQPIFELDTRTVIGFESLLRARQQGRRVEAHELIARAEDGGWLNDFDVLGRSLAVNGVGAWLDQGLLFLNVLANDGRFDLDALADTVAAAGDRNLDPDQLVFEISERNRYDSLDDAERQIEQIRELGVRIALDDLGEGHAGLASLVAFRPDIVKIGGSVVGRLPDPHTMEVARAVVEVAHRSGAWVVAENIETDDQARHAAAIGADWGQGNHLGAPTPEADGQLVIDE